MARNKKSPVKSTPLEEYEPSAEVSCLCGSGNPFGRCCESEYWKPRQPLDMNHPKKALAVARAEITWYRLCHQAHTVPLLYTGDPQGLALLGIDINAMSDHVARLLDVYDSCDILQEFPLAVETLRASIDSPRWQLALDYHLCACFFLYEDKSQAAKLICTRYRWQDLRHVNFLTLWYSLYANELNHVELVALAERIVALTDKASERLQYGCTVGIQYCLLRDLKKGIPLIQQAIQTFITSADRDPGIYGKHQLANAYKILADLSGVEAHTRSALAIYQELADYTNFKPIGLAEVWRQIGECYSDCGDLLSAKDSFERSISHLDTALTQIFLARVLLKLGHTHEARSKLVELHVTDMSDANWHDAAVSWAMLATSTRLSDDVERALAALKSVETNDPLFQEMIRRMLIDLYELECSGNSAQAESLLRKINKYLILRPNIAGVGIDINRMLDDLLDAVEL